MIRALSVDLLTLTWASELVGWSDETDCRVSEFCRSEFRRESRAPVVELSVPARGWKLMNCGLVEIV